MNRILATERTTNPYLRFGRGFFVFVSMCSMAKNVRYDGACFTIHTVHVDTFLVFIEEVDSLILCTMSRLGSSNPQFHLETGSCSV